MKRVKNKAAKPGAQAYRSVAFFKRRLRFWSFAVVASLLILAPYPVWLFWTDNLHAVRPNEFYRSAQMNAHGFETAIGNNHIRSVLNLRGPNAGTPWYDEEIRICASLGIEHADIALSSKHEITPEQLAEIDSLLQSMPKPILVHCQAGADRSGFVSAYYLKRFEGTTTAEAAKQLTVWYGHFPYFFWSSSAAMDVSFQKFCADPKTSTLPPAILAISPSPR